MRKERSGGNFERRDRGRDGGNALDCEEKGHERGGGRTCVGMSLRSMATVAISSVLL